MTQHADRLIKAIGCGLISVLALNAAHAHADDSAKIRELEMKLKRSEEATAALAEKVKRLEQLIEATPQATKPVVAAQPEVQNPSPPPQEQRITKLESDVAQLESSAGNQVQEGLPVHGFIDVGYSQVAGLDPNKLPTAARQYLDTNGFFGGSADLYLTPSFGRIKGLAEIVLDYEPDLSGNVGIDMERLQLGYTLTDDNTVWVGRFHTPYGFWNTAYHHGAELQPALSRPQFIQFEDHYGVLPAHTVGLEWDGHVKTGAGKFLYDLFIGNGDQIQIDDNTQKILNFNGYTDNDHRKIFGARFAIEPVDGLQLGVHGFNDGVGIYSNGSTTQLAQSNVRMLGGYGHYEDDNWDLLSEYYHFDNSTVQNSIDGFATDGHHKSNLWFVQAGYTFADVWFPYARYERSSLDDSDIYFSAQTGGYSYHRSLVGLRYNINTRSALKLEVSRYSVSAGTTVNSVNTPVAENYSGTDFSEVKADLSTRF